MPANVVCSAAPVVTPATLRLGTDTARQPCTGTRDRSRWPRGSGPQHLGDTARGLLDGVEDRRGRGVLAEAVALARAVVVARPGEQQPEALGELGGVGDLGGTVVAVVGLEPGEPGLTHTA